MKYTPIRIALLTLTLGIASVSFFDFAETKWREPSIDLPEAESKTLIVTPLTVQPIAAAGWTTGGIGCGRRNVNRLAVTKEKKGQVLRGKSTVIRRF